MIMETKFNIAEILKDKPQGTKLYDWLYNRDVELDTISTTDTEIVVWCTNKTDNNTTCHRGYSEFGTVRGCPDGLQILLPSKVMRDWSKFAWKKGDVLVSKDNVHIIFEKFEDNAYTRFKGKHYLWKECDEEDYSKEETQMLTYVFKKATDDAAQTYINTIEKRLGGKLNRETLEVEKAQPEFKDGDIVAVDLERKNIRIFKEKENENNFCWGKYYIGFNFNDEGKPIQIFKNYRADCVSDRFATEEEKQQLFEALAKEGKAWDDEKKAIVDLKTKVELNPFDKVLVRDRKTYHWEVDLFGFKTEGPNIVYHCVGGSWKFCIPYIGNESLLGTIKDAEK